MIEKPIPQDILKYKAKFAMGLTLRECIWGAISVFLVIIGFTILFKGIEDIKIKIICSALLASPSMIIGFVKIMEQPFEVLAKDMLIDNFVAPAIRKKEYRHPELEKWENSLTCEIETENTEDTSEVIAEDTKKKKSSKKTDNNTSKSNTSNGKIKIKKSKEYIGFK